MLALCYLIIASIAGFCVVSLFSSEIFNIEKGNFYRTRAVEIKSWLIVKPASFLIGVLCITWLTYIGAWFFKNTSSPMVYGNVISFSLTLVFILWCILKNKNVKGKWELIVNKDSLFYKGFKIDALFVIAMLILSSFLMIYTFNVKNGIMNVGYTVFSDFGPHLSVIRSFSHGSNFPTTYPHFPEGNIRYHFMFQFLAGNLEFLGLRIDWAFNIISIISLLSFIMLLHSLAVVLTGKRWIGIITSILFIFRSSLAFFTYTATDSSFSQIINKIFKVDKFIGRTEHEDWGLWAQNVYANQRHFAFSLGILALILILILPNVKNMLALLKERWEEIKGAYNEKNNFNKVAVKSKIDSAKIEGLDKLNNSTSKGFMWRSYLQIIKFYLISHKIWGLNNINKAVFLGLLLGLIAFWNGAVFIAALSMLLVLAFFSASRFEYLIIAVISGILSWLQSVWFIGANSSPVKAQIVTGFLAKSKNFTGIAEFYFELLGILIFIIIIGFIVMPKLRIFTLAFIAPFIIANILLLTPDIAVNHKYIMISVMFLNIIPAAFIYKIMASNKKETGYIMIGLAIMIVASILRFKGIAQALGMTFNVLVLLLIALSLIYFIFIKWQRIISIMMGILLLFIMTATGFVDLLTLYNVNKNSVKYDMNDPILKWVESNTEKDEIFLTHSYVCHPILLAGRRIYYGWPYFTWSAGYDTQKRGKIYKEIYSGTDSKRLKQLVKQENIDYIVIENENRNNDMYKLNESLIKNTFNLVYEDIGKKFAIYDCSE